MEINSATKSVRGRGRGDNEAGTEKYALEIFPSGGAGRIGPINNNGYLPTYRTYPSNKQQ